MINYVESLETETLKDCITGTVLFADENERARQRIFSYLLKNKGLNTEDLKAREIVKFPSKRGLSIIDLSVFINGRCCMILRYGLSSVVTRHRAALAVARLYTGKHIPYVIVTNGEYVDILNGVDGRVISSGIENIPSKKDLEDLPDDDFPDVSDKQMGVEDRILYMYDVLK